MRELADNVTHGFSQLFQNAPEVLSQSPGRINVIGEHTDYTGGLSLPAAINCWTMAAWRTRPDNLIKIYSVNMDEFWETSWTDLEKSIDNSWKKYVAGSLLLFKKDQLADNSLDSLNGFELYIEGNIPLGKGLSSSAAIELTILNGLSALYKTDLRPIDAAMLAQQVEHHYLKVKSGLLDQFACQFSKKDSALLIDFTTLDTQIVTLSKNFEPYCWVLVDSKVKRELSNSKYSERVDEYNQIKEIIKNAGKASIREVFSGEVEGLFGNAAENILKRARHIVSENERTLKAFECLKGGQVNELGHLLKETHESLSKDYEVSHPNLDYIIKASENFPGVVGGRMMGGGFGGCCLFLVKKDQLENFSEKISEDYKNFSQLETQPRSYQFVDGSSAWTYGN